jgi:micrococcal nuclease
MYEYRAEYISNYDGDTIKFIVDLGFSIYNKVTIRLAKVDTPELRSSDPAEKASAYEAKEFVRDVLVEADEIIIKTNKDKTGKYGRYIAEVIYDGNNLSYELLNNGLAKEYE